MVKPSFDWGASDKLTELEQFKVDCQILFNGPLCEEKQRAGLLMNWLSTEATQILASVESDMNTPWRSVWYSRNVFRLESNQTLSCFKFRNMKQKASQNCDSYMSELRLAIPECKYRNNADELLKDQFIFGIYNKEIKDVLVNKADWQQCQGSLWGQKDWVKAGPKKDAGDCQPRSSKCGWNKK